MICIDFWRLHEISWISCIFMDLHVFLTISWDFMDFMGFRGRRLILSISCIYIDSDLFLKIWLAGLAGWLAAGCWLDGEEEGFQGYLTRSTLWRGRWIIIIIIIGWLVVGRRREERMRTNSHTLDALERSADLFAVFFLIYPAFVPIHGLLQG